MSIPSFFELKHIFDTPESCINFLMENKIIYQTKECSLHRINMVRYGKTWRCKNKKCPQISIFQNSFFAESKIEPNQIMLILYMKLINIPSTSIQSFTGHSSSTIATYLMKYRELLAFDIKDIDIKIGGENIEVEIDETLVSRKKNPWTGKDGVWVFGGIERTREKRMFAIMVPDRTQKTLYSKIEQFIKCNILIIIEIL
jgi:hypothetical protein